MISKKLVIVGAGGFGAEAAWVAEEINASGAGSRGAEWELLGYADEDPQKLGALVEGHPVLGTLAETRERLTGIEVHYFCAVGDNQGRSRIVEQIGSWPWQAATLVHPNAVVARGACLGEGTYVGAGTTIGPGVRVGRHVILNVHVSVAHDCHIGDFVHACPGARINGACVIEEQAFLGANASVAPGVSVGRRAKVGANSFAMQAVKPGVTAIGVPARSLF